MDETVEKVPLSSWIDRDQRDTMQQLAIHGDRSLSAEVKRAVVEHLERADPEEHTK